MTGQPRAFATRPAMLRAHIVQAQELKPPRTHLSPEKTA